MSRPAERVFQEKYNYKYLSYACRFWREERGYTQSQIAEDLGYNPTTISYFESGKNNSSGIFLWYFLHGFRREDYIHFLKITHREEDEYIEP